MKAQSGLAKLAWFAAIWLMSVAALSVVAYIIRLFIT